MRSRSGSSTPEAGDALMVLLIRHVYILDIFGGRVPRMQKFRSPSAGNVELSKIPFGKS